MLGAWRAPVVMVGSDVVEVERRLRAGELFCPCGGGLAPWGHARQRAVRGVGGCVRCSMALLVQLDPLTGPLPVHQSVVADAVEAVGACAAAARRRLGVIGAVSPWQLAAAVTGGRLLAAGPA